jgi:hypothetical protein
MSIHAKKRLLILGVVIALIAGAGYIFFLRGSTGTGTSGLTDEEIMKKFDCNRATLEVRPTDIYCKNPDLYRQDVKKHTVRNNIVTN